jgi:HK97 gp10 family phage protein
MAKQDKWFIGQYIKKQEVKAEKFLDVAAEFLVGDAKLRVVVDTGNLKNSITSDREPLVAGIGSNVEYARHVEQGTEKQEAKPYLKPALDENHADLQKLFIKVMKNDT